MSSFLVGLDLDVCFFASADLMAASLLDQHHPDNLRSFARRHIRRWMENVMVVYVGWGHGKPIQCEVNEIEPEGDHLLSQNQYRPNLETGELETVRVPSPPIGMMGMLIDDWRKKLDKYLNETLEMDFEDFPECCFQGREIEVQRDLLHSVHRCYMSWTGNVSKITGNWSLLLTYIRIIEKGKRLSETGLQARHCYSNNDAYFDVDRR